MKRITTAVAYPTIPIIFLGGIKPDRIPLYDTMGLAITSLDNKTRTETTVESSFNSKEEITFFLNGEKLKGKRGEQILSSIQNFMNNSDKRDSIVIHSRNYDIFSGSSDSGLAALFTALNDFLELNYNKDELLKYALKGSESAGRSLYGGLTLSTVKTNSISVYQLASEQKLTSLKLFTVPFYYKSRISADEIHASIITNPKFNNRVKQIPYWIKKIQDSLSSNDFLSVLKFAEENIQNAHELLEGVGLFIRKSEILRLCNDVVKMREIGIPAFYLIGGGNLVTIATIEKYMNNVTQQLKEKKWSYFEYKVAGSPRIIKSIK